MAKEIDPLKVVETKKMDGNEFFRIKQYDKALFAFDSAIKSLEQMVDSINKTKVNELLSTCHNNIAACYEVMVGFFTVDHIFE